MSAKIDNNRVGTRRERRHAHKRARGARPTDDRVNTNTHPHTLTNTVHYTAPGQTTEYCARTSPTAGASTDDDRSVVVRVDQITSTPLRAAALR